MLLGHYYGQGILYLLQGTTDAKGRYTVAGLPVGQKLWFGTSHPKFSDANAACDADLKNFDIELDQLELVSFSRLH